MGNFRRLLKKRLKSGKRCHMSSEKIKRKIAVVTGTRAEYGLLYWLMREIQQDQDLELQLIVTSMHLSPEFGYTYKLIEADGFKISEKIEILLSSDSSIGTAKSIGLCIIGFADAFARLQPDIVVLLGDRFEALAVAQTTLVQKIPLAHIHGGELSEGAVDDSIRHSITKMAHLHFVAADRYRDRIIQLGEQPNRIFNFGAPGLERISRANLLDLPSLEKSIDFEFGKTTFLVSYLPPTLETEKIEKEIFSIFGALDHFKQAKIIFTKANADEAGRFINGKIDDYTNKNPERAAAYITLGDINYLSALQFVDVVIGNSSSGIIEAPCFKKPTVNIGSRQEGRLHAESILTSNGEKKDLIEKIEKALSTDFRKNLADTKLLYSQDTTATKIKDELKRTNLTKIMKKKFFDLQKR